MIPIDKVAELSPSTLRGSAEQLLRFDPELSYGGYVREQFLDELAVKRPALIRHLGKELADWNTARRFWVGREFAMTLTALTVLVVALVLGLWSMNYPSETPWTVARLVASAVVVLAGVLVVLLSSSMFRQWRLGRAVFREAVRTQLRALIREVAAEFETTKSRWANSFDATVAPALVELDIDDAVPSDTYAKVRAFVTDHEASAIGIAGPRGSGKSTLMEQLRFDPDHPSLSIRISAPVSYSPAEFTRIIHTQLARTAAGQRSDSSSRPSLRALMVELRPVFHGIGMVILAGVLFAAFLYDQQELLPERLAGFHIGAVGLLAVVGAGILFGFLANKAWRLFMGRVRLASYPPTVAGLGRQQLDLLRWKATLEGNAKTSLKVGGFGFESSDKLSRAERDISHGEAVHDLRRFVEQLVALYKGRILVCVDELDKLSDPAHAIDTINGMKDLFHVPGAHFLLSVSTDALHRFAARGVPVRDVFDSSFDSIVRMAPLTFEECRSLVDRRARNFTSPAVLFCYAWSGGNARDLIRAARACVEFRRAHKGAVPLRLLVSHVLRADLGEVLDAAMQRLSEAGSDALRGEVLAFKDLLETEAAPLGEIIAAAREGAPLPTGPHGGSEAEILAGALDPYVRIAGMIMRLFDRQRTQDQWQHPDVLRAVTAAAEARAALARHPEDARRRVTAAEKFCLALVM